MKGFEKYEDEHFTLFRSKGDQYPPEKAATIACYSMDYTGLTNRESELVVFATTYFPAKKAMEFMDVNSSLGSLVNFKAKSSGSDSDPKNIKNPWRSRPSTLVGSSTMVVRVDSADFKVVRPLYGFEYMDLIGWSFESWSQCSDMPSRI